MVGKLAAISEVKHEKEEQKNADGQRRTGKAGKRETVPDMDD